MLSPGRPGSSNRPPSRRLYQIQRPVPSNDKTFKRSRRRFQNTNNAPDSGFCCRRSRTAASSPSKERRISTGSRQTRTRVDTGSVNIPPPRATPRAAAKRPRQTVPESQASARQATAARSRRRPPLAVSPRGPAVP